MLRLFNIIICSQCICVLFQLFLFNFVFLGLLFHFFTQKSAWMVCVPKQCVVLFRLGSLAKRTDGRVFLPNKVRNNILCARLATGSVFGVFFVRLFPFLPVMSQCGAIRELFMYIPEYDAVTVVFAAIPDLVLSNMFLSTALLFKNYFCAARDEEGNDSQLLRVPKRVFSDHFHTNMCRHSLFLASTPRRICFIMHMS